MVIFVSLKWNACRPSGGAQSADRRTGPMKACRRQTARLTSRPLSRDLTLRLVDRPASLQAHDVGLAPGDIVIGHARAVSPDGGTCAGSLVRVHLGRGFEVEGEL
ncbi:hypothetical protein [Sphingomonas sp. SORGH_AS_0879]|uniref:hypothetical protein n=1 Tax=Sphingomonas sp. SORGH_AS_0879 TaxID=3041790 RepID=UPI00278950A2|nr:hypothetical protein [Sphingomonas sp. SORGH_AS_0879]MDQ1231469.1 hypothetical protein [Sphingomonas sp. SORGH_AS_0879]